MEKNNSYLEVNEIIIPEADAYWVSPDGKIYNIKNTQTHIKYVCVNTRLFKLHSDSIRDIYNSFGEKKGTEGKTSEVIIKKLISDGWIRIRKFEEAELFFIHCDLRNDKVKENIKPFIDYIKSGKFNGYKVWFLNKEDNEKTFSMDSFKKSLLFEELKKIQLEFKIFSESDGFYYYDLIKLK